MLAEGLGRVVEFRDGRHIIADGTGNRVIERTACQFHLVFPGQCNFISLGTEVRSIDFRRAGSEHCRKFLRRGKHVLGVPDIEIGTGCQSVAEETEVKSQVIGNDRFPCEAFSDGTRRADLAGKIGAVEGIVHH